jgi:hypothetical protein
MMANAQAAQNTQDMKKGMGQVLEGCATCCDGVRREAQAAGLSDDVMKELDQAIRICRDVAQRLNS